MSILKRTFAAASLSAAISTSHAANITIPLGNLFDDGAATSLAAAIASDTYQAAADTSDLGVITVLNAGGLNAAQTIAPGVSFNFSSAGGGDNNVGGEPSNDTYRSSASTAIRTTGVLTTSTTKLQEGIGMHADEAITFDLAILATAGGVNPTDITAASFSAIQGLNDSSVANGSARTAVVFSNSSGVLAGYVNGTAVAVSQSGGVWSFTGVVPGTFSGSGASRYTSLLNLNLPAGTQYLTLAALASGNANSDHIVFTPAELNVTYIPEPSAAILALLGSLMAFRRRR